MRNSRLGRQRRLPVARRRQHLEAPRPRRQRAHRPHRAAPRATPTPPGWRRSAASGARTPSAASSRPATAAPPGRKVLYVDERTGAADLVADPANPQQAVRRDVAVPPLAVLLPLGRPGLRPPVTHDGGATWKKLQEEDGLPEGPLGRIGVAISPLATRGRLRAGRGREERARALRGRRPQLQDGERHAQRRAAAVLLRRPPRRPRVAEPRLLASTTPCGCPTTAARRSTAPGVLRGARRLPRDVDRPARSRPPPGRRRRRRAREPRPRPHDWLRRQPAAGPVLPHRGRRPDGRTASWAGCRTTARGAARAPCGRQGGIRNHEWAMVGGGDGYDVQPDPVDADDRLRDVAGRQPDALGRAHRRAARSSRRRARGRSCASTGTPASRSTRSSPARSTTAASSSTARPTAARRWTIDQPRPDHQQPRVAAAGRLWRAHARRHRGGELLHDPDDRAEPGRPRRAAGSGPTTAASTSPATAAPPGRASRAASRASRPPPGSRTSRRRASTPARRSWCSTTTGARTGRRTSTAPPTTARPGPRSSPPSCAAGRW